MSIITRTLGAILLAAALTACGGSAPGYSGSPASPGSSGSSGSPASSPSGGYGGY